MPPHLARAKRIATGPQLSHLSRSAARDDRSHAETSPGAGRVTSPAVTPGDHLAERTRGLDAKLMTQLRAKSLEPPHRRRRVPSGEVGFEEYTLCALPERVCRHGGKADLHCCCSSAALDQPLTERLQCLQAQLAVALLLEEKPFVVPAWQEVDHQLVPDLVQAAGVAALVKDLAYQPARQLEIHRDVAGEGEQ